MLTANTLRALADAADAAAEAGAVAPERRHAVAIAASDARQVAEAGSGYGTPETLALVVVIDNDSDFAEWRAGMVRQFLAESYADEAANAEEEDALRISYIADALAAMVEELAGFEGFHPFPNPSGEVTPRSSVRASLPDAAHALARAAFRNVDWIGLARHYVAEERRNPTGGAR